MSWLAIARRSATLAPSTPMPRGSSRTDRSGVATGSRRTTSFTLCRSRSWPAFRTILMVGLAVSASVSLSGCAAAVPAVAALSAGAGAAEAGFGVWDGSRLKYVDEVPFEVMSTAIDTVSDDLLMSMAGEEINFRGEDAPRRRVVRLYVDTGKFAKVTVTRMTDEVTYVIINVGPFGNKAAARLFADRIQMKANEWTDDPEEIEARDAAEREARQHSVQGSELPPGTTAP